MLLKLHLRKNGYNTPKAFDRRYDLRFDPSALHKNFTQMCILIESFDSLILGKFYTKRNNDICRV